MIVMCGIVNTATGKTTCPLTLVEVSALIDSRMAKVTLTQNFINTSHKNIEAVYIFPISVNAQVTGFVAKIGGYKVTGELREKEAAFREYDRIIRQGNNAFLLESHRPDILQISLGNLGAGENVAIEITYIEEMKIVDNELRWVLPTVVAPRYIPGDTANIQKTGLGTHKPTDRVPDADYITPPVDRVHYSLNVNVRLNEISRIRKVESPSHPISIAKTNDSIMVSLTRQNELLDRDFILAAQLDEYDTNYLIAANTGAGEAFAYARIMLDLDETEAVSQHYDYAFVLDISGSMAGVKLEQSKRALSISLRNLLEGDMFNIVAFAGNYICFAPAPVPYTQETLTRADKWIAALEGRGNTEILEPMKFVLDNNTDQLDKVVLLFTDGQVGNEDEIVKLVKSNNHRLNLFAFGIDTSINKYFIDSVAKAGNGIPEYIYPGERIDDKVIRHFSRIHRSYLSNPRVFDRDGTELTPVPELPSRLLSGEEYSFSVCSDTIDKLEKIILKGVFNNQNKEIILEGSLNGDGHLLSLQWAQENIRALEMEAGSGNPRRNKLIRQEIVELSIKYGLLSTLTSLVSVFTPTIKKTGIPETVVVPVAPPRDWDMFADNSYSNISATSGKTMKERFPDLYQAMEIPPFLRKSDSRSQKNPPKNMNESLFAVQPSGIGDDSSYESSSKNQILSWMRNAAEKQNANGSFGNSGQIYIRTSCFIIGMLLCAGEWKPYTIQIKKAGEYLLNSNSTDWLLMAIAFHMLIKNKVLKTGRAQEDLNSALQKLTSSQEQVYETFIAGNVQEITGIISSDKPEEHDTPAIIRQLLQIAGES